ncbi:hypothetical protein [Mesobacillus sp.]
MSDLDVMTERARLKEKVSVIDMMTDRKSGNEGESVRHRHDEGQKERD